MKLDLSVRRLLLALMCMLLLYPVPALAQGQSWPGRPIRLIVPQGPGSGTDTIARLIADGLTSRLGQPMVVENLPAASGLLAHQVAARAAPDGTTFLFSTVSGFAINPVTVKALPYDAAKDFTPVAMVVDFAPQMLSVNAEMPIQSVSEFVSYAKANPGKLSYGLRHYRHGRGGFGAAACQASRARHGRGALPLAGTDGYRRRKRPRAGDGQFARRFGRHDPGRKIRPLGWFSSKRFSYQPDTPTVAEAVPGVAIDAWFIIVAPTGTPTEAINRLNQEINEVLKAGDIGARFAKVELGVSGTGTPNSLAVFIRSEQEKWRSLALELNLEAQ